MFDVQHGWDEGNHRSLRIFHWPDWYFSVSPFQGRFGVLAVRCQILTTMSDDPSWAALACFLNQETCWSQYSRKEKKVRFRTEEVEMASHLLGRRGGETPDQPTGTERRLSIPTSRYSPLRGEGKKNRQKQGEKKGAKKVASYILILLIFLHFLSSLDVWTILRPFGIVLENC